MQTKASSLDAESLEIRSCRKFSPRQRIGNLKPGNYVDSVP